MLVELFCKIISYYYLLVILFLNFNLQLTLQYHRKQVSKTIWAEEGKEAYLPCNITTDSSDKVNMVLWFKEPTEIPIYSIDGRSEDLSKGTHLVTGDLGKRCYFNTIEEHLKITNVIRNDEGIYKCRIDYANSQTKHFYLQLSIIEFPSVPVIMDELGNVVTDKIGPFFEGDSARLTCTVSGGKPNPTITWWLGDEMLSEMADRMTNSEISSDLKIQSVSRSYNGREIQCRVTMDGSAKIIQKSIRIELYVKPAAVSILQGYNSLHSGKSQQIVCECSGSYPPAKITWFLNSKPVKQVAVTASEDESISRSVLTIRPDYMDHMQVLTCRAENPMFLGYFLDDQKSLNVYYKPRLKVSIMPSNTNLEGSDIILECIADSNPVPDQFTWFRNEIRIENEGTKDKLAINNATRQSAGDYTCEASNTEGTSTSESNHLKILHAPICKEEQENQTVTSKKGSINIIQCDVLAEPSTKSVRFFWTFNKSDHDVSPVSNSKVESSGLKSILRYKPVVNEDFGTLACWAENEIGKQITPCYFHIVEAHKPKRPENCSVIKEYQKIRISCTPVPDDDEKQYYILEVRTTTRNNRNIKEDNIQIEHLNDETYKSEIQSTPLYSFRSENPIFEIFNLEEEKPYVLALYTANIKDISDPVIILQESKSEMIVKHIKPHEISQDYMETTITLPTSYIIGIVCIILLIVILIPLIASIIACRRSNTMSDEMVERELNNFRLIFGDLDDDKPDNNINLETQFS